MMTIYQPLEPLLRQCIYAFSDTIYDAYPNLKIQKMEFSVERSALEVNHDYNIPVTISPRNVKDAKITYTILILKLHPLMKMEPFIPMHLGNLL